MAIGQVYTPAQMAGALKAAGFTGSDIAIGVAVGMAESGGKSVASKPNSNGSIDYGVWQINSVHRDILASGNWADLYDNARMARKVFLEAGGKWSPWVTYWRGTYKQYMGQGLAGAGNPSTAPAPNAQNVDAGGALDGISNFFSFITNVDNWVRLGQFAAGMILLLIGLWQMTGIDAGKVASTAAKVAVLA